MGVHNEDTMSMGSKKSDVEESSQDDLDFVFIDQTPVSPARRTLAPVVDPRALIQITLDGHTYRSDGEIHIGRGVDNHLIARTDQAVSRHHCRIFREGNHAVIEDLGSRWGTFVDGQRIRRHYLRGDERIQVARTEFKLGLVETPARTRAVWPGAMEEDIFDSIAEEPTLESWSVADPLD
jgi:pSer/pThr/pTyr-binding forkhead associated (FHA) protein